MRFLILTLIVASFTSSTLFAATSSPEKFLKDYLSDAVKLHAPRKSDALKDNKVMRAMLNQALKLQRLWVRPKNPPLDGNFLRKAAGRECRVEDRLAQAAYVRLKAVCGPGNTGYYLLADTHRGWRIKAFADDPGSLDESPGHKAQHPAQGTNTRAAVAGGGGDTPEAQVELFMNTILKELGKNAARKHNNLDFLVNATRTMWADTSRARQAQAKAVGFFSFMKPESFDVTDVKGDNGQARVEIEMRSGNAHWGKIGGKMSGHLVFVAERLDGKWYLTGFDRPGQP